MKKEFKDPLNLDIKETTKNVIKGVVILGIGIPLISSLSNLIGGTK